MSIERATFLETGGSFPAAGVWNRIYVGSEFCPWLLPATDELDRLLDEAGRRDWAVTLATSCLTDESLQRAGALLEHSRDAGLEVVVNDWGLVDLAGARGWGFPLSLGRLLVHASVGSTAGPQGAADYLASSSLSSTRFVSFLLSLGIGRAEIDDPRHRAAGPLALSLHGPDRYITMAARCPWRCDGRRWESGPCPRPCRGREFRLARAGDGFILKVRGRAQFLTWAPDPASLELPGVDRLVWHPTPEAQP